MLVLARKAGQTIIVGDDIKIVIIEIEGGQVRLGVEAPRDIRVLRKELLKENSKQKSELAAIPLVAVG